MKYYSVLIYLTCCMFIVSVSQTGAKTYLRIKKDNFDLQRKIDSSKFISESFRNTCRGVGFTSLNQWQKVCKDLWNLDYIGWSNASEFMVIDESVNGTLLYGKWYNNLLEGEVYSRVKNEEYSNK